MIATGTLAAASRPPSSAPIRSPTGSSPRPVEQALVDATRVVIAHPGAGRHRRGLRRRAVPLRRQPSRDQRHDRVLRAADGGHPQRDRASTSWLAYRAQRRACASAPGRPASSKARSARGTLDLPLACQRAQALATAAVQVHPHRAAHAGQDAARHATTGTRAELAHGDRRRARRAGARTSTPTSSRSTRPTCPATPRNGSGPPRRSTACSTRCTTTPAVHLCFGNYGGQSIQKGTWDKLMRYLNALHADHVVLEMRAPPARGARGVPGPAAARSASASAWSTSRRPRSRSPTRSRARSSAPRALLGAGRVRYIHPDCGFWMLKRSIADAKIRALVEGRDLYEGRAH